MTSTECNVTYIEPEQANSSVNVPSANRFGIRLPHSFSRA